MAATDTIAPRIFDLREISSDYSLSCPTHGGVKMVVQFNGDWNRTYCCDCWETEVARASKRVTLNTNGGPQPMNRTA